MNVTCAHDELHSTATKSKIHKTTGEQINQHDRKQLYKPCGKTKTAPRGILILLFIMVTITWGTAAFGYLGLIDYNAVIAQGSSISSSDIMSLMFAPLQLEIFQHPIRSLGNSLVLLDDFLHSIFTSKEKVTYFEKKRQVAINSPVEKHVYIVENKVFISRKETPNEVKDVSNKDVTGKGASLGLVSPREVKSNPDKDSLLISTKKKHAAKSKSSRLKKKSINDLMKNATLHRKCHPSFRPKNLKDSAEYISPLHDFVSTVHVKRKSNIVETCSLKKFEDASALPVRLEQCYITDNQTIRKNYNKNTLIRPLSNHLYSPFNSVPGIVSSNTSCAFLTNATNLTFVRNCRHFNFPTSYFIKEKHLPAFVQIVAISKLVINACSKHYSINKRFIVKNMPVSKYFLHNLQIKDHLLNHSITIVNLSPVGRDKILITNYTAIGLSLPSYSDAFNIPVEMSKSLSVWRYVKDSKYRLTLFKILLLKSKTSSANRFLVNSKLSKKVVNKYLLNKQKYLPACLVNIRKKLLQSAQVIGNLIIINYRKISVYKHLLKSPATFVSVVVSKKTFKYSDMNRRNAFSKAVKSPYKKVINLAKLSITFKNVGIYTCNSLIVNKPLSRSWLKTVFFKSNILKIVVNKMVYCFYDSCHHEKIWMNKNWEIMHILRAMMHNFDYFFDLIRDWKTNIRVESFYESITMCDCLTADTSSYIRNICSKISNLLQILINNKIQSSVFVMLCVIFGYYLLRYFLHDHL